MIFAAIARSLKKPAGNGGFFVAHIFVVRKRQGVDLAAWP
jgi:hypothetical protein